LHPVTEPLRRIRIADALPEILDFVDPSQHLMARRHLVAQVLMVEPGTWSPPAPPRLDPGHLGLLVLEGLMTRDVIMEEPLATELVGRGDLLRPADNDGKGAPIPFDVQWRVQQRAQLAILDAEFTRRATNWPSVLEFVVRSMTSRAHSLAVSMAISHLRHVDTRLLVLLWYLADRWGRVRPEGVVVPVRLTHETLGRLIGARRPSVTTALRALTQEGRVSRSPERFWVLHGDPPTSLTQRRAPSTLTAIETGPVG
jgi:CRP-like cAMP-binding protein